ncbi:MAG TPA: hypothetical protein VEU55_09585 [Gemmatimonadales bacterium]|nr:hypothetical protein [Gemmatimonadales bacterium]
MATVGAQQPTPPPPDSAHAESTHAPPPVPSPDQRRFLDGLRTARRGIAQLKDGLNRVSRAQATDDSTTERTAGRFLAGLCGSARAFLKRGRPHMNPTVYSDSTRLSARRLVTQVDSLIGYASTCEASAAAAPVPVAADLAKRMKTYDAALRDFLVAIGQPVKDDTSKAARKP